MGGRVWDQPELAYAVAVLRASRTVVGACRVMSVGLGRPVTQTNLENIFLTRKMLAPKAYLPDPRIDLPPMPPVPGAYQAAPDPNWGEIFSPASAVTGRVHSGTEESYPPEDPVERLARETKDARHRREYKDMAKELDELRRIVASREKLASAPLPPITRREFASGMREATAVAMLSDLHVEERVLPTDTPTGNAYSLEISALRLARAFAGIEWLVEKERGAFKIRDLILWIGGDTVSGHIHEENVETSAMPPIAALLWLQP
jgi:hypothetical protein